MNGEEIKEVEPIKTNWVVVTGPPSSGKTTTLDNLMGRLAVRGHSLIEEQARKLINEDKGKGLQRLGNRDYEIELNNRVLGRREEIERSLNPNSHIFMDRGTPDVVSYMRYYGQDDKEARELSRNVRYAIVFYLEPLIKYEQDTTRVEAVEFAKWMHENLPRVYKELGYDVVRVPVFPYGEKSYTSEDEKRKDSLDQRSRFIMARLRQGFGEVKGGERR